MRTAFCHLPQEDPVFRDPFLDIYTLTSTHTGNFHPHLQSADQVANKPISLEET